MVGFIGDLGSSYSTTADFSSINRTQQAMNKQINNTRQLQEDLEAFKVSNVWEAFEIPYEMIKFAWTSVKTIFGGWGVIQSIIGDLSNSLTESGVPIPSWLISTIIAIIVITLIAIVIYAFFKWKFED